jgi:hypothetical protein
MSKIEDLTAGYSDYDSQDNSPRKPSVKRQTNGELVPISQDDFKTLLTPGTGEPKKARSAR